MVVLINAFYNCNAIEIDLFVCCYQLVISPFFANDERARHRACRFVRCGSIGNHNRKYAERRGLVRSDTLAELVVLDNRRAGWHAAARDAGGQHGGFEQS
jgi:hypothetical protein